MALYKHRLCSHFVGVILAGLISGLVVSSTYIAICDLVLFGDFCLLIDFPAWPELYRATEFHSGLLHCRFVVYVRYTNKISSSSSDTMGVDRWGRGERIPPLFSPRGTA